MKTGKWLVIFLMSAVALGGCGAETTQQTIVEVQESPLNEPQKTEVVRGDITVASYFDAQVGPKVEQLSFAEEGTFGEFFVKLGDEVKKGDILATPALESVERAIESKEKEIEDLTRTYEYQKATLENSLAIANKELENVYETIETLEYLSAEYTAACKQAGTFDEQRMKLELQLKQLKETYDLQLPYQQGKLRELREERDGNMIVAPFDGTIIALESAQYGDRINVDNYYVAIADTSVMYARCEAVSITVLNKLEKTLFWKAGKEYEVVSIPMEHDYYMATINSGEDAYSEFQITDTSGEVAIGEYGKIKLVSEEKQNVLLIPETTLQLTNGSYYVYKDVDGRHERVPVKIGCKDGINVEIVEGLEEGDVVYVQE